MGLVVSNSSKSTRVLQLRRQRITLVPGQVYNVPSPLEEEMIDLLNSNTFQKIMGAGLLRASQFDEEKEALVEQETPEVPEDLRPEVQIGDGSTSTSVVTPMTVVEHQTAEG